MSVEPPGQFSRSLAAVVPDAFNKAYFVRELHALGAWTENSQHIMDLLGDRFTRGKLSDAIDAVRAKVVALRQVRGIKRCLALVDTGKLRATSSAGIRYIRTGYLSIFRK